MGEAPSPSVVADSGPLIHLHEIGQLPLLGVVFSIVHVPHAVWDESVTGGRVPARELEVAAALQRYQITPQQFEQIAALPAAAGLHRGELECLSLCQAIQARLLLTDDLAARHAAKLLGIQPVGSLGVVVRAHHEGQLALPEAEDAIEKLHRVSTLFVSRAIVDMAIAQLRQPVP